ncbi:GNAT family N-acetyltransferase [Pedobacter montanisoli]|uniref:GNAT family N-acetyltransferase n=1 Tax=Pedobacter montanisoli TaxID=2923277 RepID=A0ABS9ZXG8_9SPHI|nr:GNAT family N-acetyltransferase [Pedobacter montanisoli]MCJ0742987.1 GNAT family N-acetyltransferase [Pedobacter montanisoli]
MEHFNPIIEKYTNEQKKRLLAVWEKSVLATHHFLSTEDFVAIKKLLQNFDFTTLNVYCLNHHAEMIGFIATSAAKIEMLFLSPNYFGKGLGKKLMNFAMSTLNANEVDVNEQNQNAVKFYKSLGFVPFERTEKDDLGKGYPLLRMLLEQHTN